MHGRAWLHSRPLLPMRDYDGASVLPRVGDSVGREFVVPGRYPIRGCGVEKRQHADLGERVRNGRRPLSPAYRTGGVTASGLAAPAGRVVTGIA